MAVDAFLKFEGVEGEAHKLGHDFHKLGDGFADLGGAFLKLVDDVSPGDVDSFKGDLAAHIKHDVFAIGQSFFKVGDDFLKLSDPLHKFDDAIVKFTDQFIKVTPSDSEVPPLSLAADFLKYETDVKLTGLDFLAAASDVKMMPTESLSLNFSKISVEYKAQSDDELKIAGDLVDFIRISGFSDSDAGAAFLKFAGDSEKIGADYLKLSVDFQQISSDFVPTEGSGPLKFDQVVAAHADDFIKLSTDLKLTNADLGALGGDFHKLAEAFESPGQVTTPTFKLG
jgi:hypothetical protein